MSQPTSGSGRRWKVRRGSNFLYLLLQSADDGQCTLVTSIITYRKRTTILLNLSTWESKAHQQTTSKSLKRKRRKKKIYSTIRLAPTYPRPPLLHFAGANSFPSINLTNWHLISLFLSIQTGLNLSPSFNKRGQFFFLCTLILVVFFLSPFSSSLPSSWPSLIDLCDGVCDRYWFRGSKHQNWCGPQQGYRYCKCVWRRLPLHGSLSHHSEQQQYMQLK